MLFLLFVSKESPVRNLGRPYDEQPCASHCQELPSGDCGSLI